MCNKELKGSKYRKYEAGYKFAIGWALINVQLSAMMQWQTMKETCSDGKSYWRPEYMEYMDGLVVLAVGFSQTPHLESLR